MAINTTELRAVLKEIEAHPETWNQKSWALRTACGTRFCFAGHVVARSPEYEIVWGAASEEVCLETHLCQDEQGHRKEISVAAQRILGLTIAQADELFNWENSLDDLRRIVERLCAEAEEEEETA